MNSELIQQCGAFVQERCSIPRNESLDGWLNDNGSDLTSSASHLFLNALLQFGIEHGATRLSIEPEVKSTFVRMYMNNAWHDILLLLPESQPALVKAIRTTLGVHGTEAHLHGAFLVQVDDDNITVSTSVISTVHGYSIQLRLNAHRRVEQSFESLGMKKVHATHLKSILDTMQGVVLVVADDITARHRIAYTIADYVNMPNRNVTLIEHTTDYIIEGVTQSIVEPKETATAIEHALSSDPDVLISMEVPDNASAQWLMTTGQAGHLVIATIGANGARDAIKRLHSLGISRRIAREAVKAIVRIQHNGVISVIQ